MKRVDFLPVAVRSPSYIEKSPLGRWLFMLDEYMTVVDHTQSTVVRSSYRFDQIDSEYKLRKRSIRVPMLVMNVIVLAGVITGFVYLPVDSWVILGMVGGLWTARGIIAIFEDEGCQELAAFFDHDGFQQLEILHSNPETNEFVQFIDELAVRAGVASIEGK